MSLKEKFTNLEPGRKKVVIWSLIGVTLFLVTIVGYNSKDRSVLKTAESSRTKSIRLDPDLIQKTMLREQRRELDELRKSVEIMQQQQKRPVSYNNASGKGKNSGQGLSGSKLPEIPSADQVTETKRLSPPPPPGKRSQQGTKGSEGSAGIKNRNKQNSQNRTPEPPMESQMIGNITVLSNPSVATVSQADKKKGRTVYLPPSFMEAKLLTGFDASTSGKGKNNPEPLLLRIQTPAVLPNDIKANLAGCFVIAEAVGRLDKERADVRLVSLSCLSNEGGAVIDTPIKGFVTDSDSKVGLSGRVVSRMGAAAARAVVSGFFSGMGDMLKAAATTTSTSALGTTSTVDSSQIAKYSVGGGLSEGASNLSDFYLTLAKQTTPIIEVGAAKQITVIISEGKELEIRELENDEAL